jgi:hypothetical protein
MERSIKESIIEILSENKQGLHVRDITTHLTNKYSSDLFQESKLEYEKILEKVNRILANDVKKGANSIFSKVKEAGKNKKGKYRLKTVRKPPLPEPPTPPIPESDPDTPHKLPENLYTGKAGECAVMSELLFRGYNVNSMLVDDGVDIIASKNNMFYYLQVKTTTLNNNNRIYATIKEKRFNDYIGSQIRYVVVVRCLLNGFETNMYFIFNNNDIKRYLFGSKAKSSNGNIYLKIDIDLKDNKPYIYDEKRESIEYNMNNFIL